MVFKCQEVFLADKMLCFYLTVCSNINSALMSGSVLADQIRSFNRIVYLVVLKCRFTVFKCREVVWLITFDALIGLCSFSTTRDSTYCTYRVSRWRSKCIHVCDGAQNV